MQIKSYGAALNYLEGFIGKIIFKVNKEFLKKHDPLERMRIFLSFLGNPQEKFKSILVGGTAGKGSTAYLISHILTQSGYKTGFTVSPHLQKVNERLQINNKEISDEKFTKNVNSIVQTIELMKKMEIGAPSYFEIIVGMAFRYFADQKVDIVIAEVGMGGEFDATNTLNPLVAVLTNVGLDHTNILGKTVEKIAKTKAGIIKKLKIKNEKLKMTVITGVKQPTVIKIIENRCEKMGAQLNLLWRNFGYKIKKVSRKESVFDLITDSDRMNKLNDLQLSLLGNYQVENASLAVRTVLELRKFGFSHFAKASRDKKIADKAIRKALKTAFFPGRFEILSRHPEFISGSSPSGDSLQSKEMLKQVQHDKGVTIVLDGAHNPTKMKEFLKSLKKLYPPTSPRLRGTKKIFLVGFKFDKDIKKMLKEILAVADEIIITQFKAKTDTSVHASADAFNVKSQIAKLKSGTKVTVEKDSKKALKMGLKTIQQYNNLPRRPLRRIEASQAGSAILVVTGSLYLVGEIRSML